MICYQRAQLGLLIVAVLVLVLGILAIFAAADMVYQKEISKWKLSVCVGVCECMVCLECFINLFFQSALDAITSDTVRLGS